MFGAPLALWVGEESRDESAASSPACSTRPRPETPPPRRLLHAACGSRRGSRATARRARGSSRWAAHGWLRCGGRPCRRDSTSSRAPSPAAGGVHAGFAETRRARRRVSPLPAASLTRAPARRRSSRRSPPRSARADPRRLCERGDLVHAPLPHAARSTRSASSGAGAPWGPRVRGARAPGALGGANRADGAVGRSLPISALVRSSPAG